MAKVGGEIATVLHESGHEIIYLACGSREVDPDQYPFKIIPTEQDSWGKDIFDQVVYGERPDVVLTIGDPWFYDYLTDPNQCKSRNLFSWVGYLAVDGEKIGGGLPNFWGKVVVSMDRVIAYTDFGKDALLKSFPFLEGKLPVIYHGVNEKDYYPLPPEVKKKFRGRYTFQDRFIFLCVARNQGRKNWPELFKAWKIVQEEGMCPGAVLWPHTYFYDPAGHNIDDLLATFDLAGSQSIVFFSQIARGSSFSKLISKPELNILYNMSNALVSIGGEGFGLPVIEAMAAKVPTLVLNESATGELGGEERSFLVEAGHYLTGRYLTERPVPEPRAIAEAMQQMYKDEGGRTYCADKAYRFALDHTWTKVGEQWVAFFDKLESPTKYPMILEEVGV